MPAVTPETLDVIRAGVRDGRTYSEIAADLDISRNAVAGAVYRHAKDVQRPEGTATRRRNAGRRPSKPKAVKPPTPPRPPRVAKAKPLPVEPAPIECRVIPFVVASGCRWPLWSADDPLETKSVCGARCSDGNPYCAGHFRLAHRDTKRRAA